MVCDVTNLPETAADSAILYISKAPVLWSAKSAYEKEESCIVQWQIAMESIELLFLGATAM